MNPGRVWLLACLALACCEQSPQNQSDGHGEEDAQHDSGIQIKAERFPWDIRNFGIDSAKDLLPFVTDSTADGSTHTWIYKIDKEGAREWGFLFLRSGSQESVTYEVFHEAYADRTVTRTLLNASEIELKIDELGQLLTDNGAHDRFEYFYGGGRLPENGSEPIDENEPFGGPEIDVNTPQVQREISDHINEMTLWKIATIIRYYHRTINKVEQGVEPDAGNAPE